jgi:hypothetical protein
LSQKRIAGRLQLEAEKIATEWDRSVVGFPF